MWFFLALAVIALAAVVLVAHSPRARAPFTGSEPSPPRSKGRHRGGRK